MSTDNLVQLADSIAAKAKAFSAALKAKGIAEPSLAETTASEYLPFDDVELQRQRTDLINASRLLNDIVQSPKARLVEIAISMNHDLTTMHFIYAYDIPSHVPTGGEISYADLAKACGLQQVALKRVLQFAMMNRIFIEPKPGFVAHSAISRYLAEDPYVMSLLGHCTEDIPPMVRNQVAALRKWPNESDMLPDRCGHSYLTGETWFETLAKDKPRVERFANAMKAMSTPGGFMSADVVKTAFDWSKLGDGLVVDVGGSHGHSSAAILSVAPKMRAIVQDLPEVVEQDHAIPPEVADRLTFQAHNFFEPQPVKDADVYFFSTVFHDWPDTKCKEILQNLIPSMKSGSRIVIVDFVLLPPGQGSWLDQRFARGCDMQMFVAIWGKERTLEEWDDLMLTVSPGSLKFESAQNRFIVYQKV